MTIEDLLNHCRYYEGIRIWLTKMPKDVIISESEKILEDSEKIAFIKNCFETKNELTPEEIWKCQAIFTEHMFNKKCFVIDKFKSIKSIKINDSSILVLKTNEIINSSMREGIKKEVKEKYNCDCLILSGDMSIEGVLQKET